MFLIFEFIKPSTIFPYLYVYAIVCACACACVCECVMIDFNPVITLRIDVKNQREEK